MADLAGIEPATYALTVRRSATELQVNNAHCNSSGGRAVRSSLAIERLRPIVFKTVFHLVFHALLPE